MKAHHPTPFRIVLPLASFVLRPLTAAVIAAVHVYLAAGQGFGALAGAYVFAALASRGLARGEGRRRLDLDSERRGASQGVGSSSA